MFLQTLTFFQLLSADLPELQQIAQRTFHDSFAAANNPEDFQTYTKQAFSKEQLLSELQNPNSTFYFAKFQDKTIAYFKLNTGSAQTDLQEEAGIELERIYVKQEFQGQKTGQALIEKAIEIAKEKNKTYLWLGVWDQNKRAIRFYQRSGFQITGSHPFKMGKEKQTDLVLKLQISGI